jgi:hypothetical protein
VADQTAIFPTRFARGGLVQAEPGALELGLQRGQVLGVFEQVEFRQELAEVLGSEAIVRAIETQRVELLTLPAIDVDRTGCGGFSGAAGCLAAFNPASRYGLPVWKNAWNSSVKILLVYCPDP